MKRRSGTSTTLTKARSRATRHGWDASWIRSEVDARAVLDGGCYYDPEGARRVLNYFKLLRHSEGEWAGQPFIPLKWQWERILQPLFGWKRADGTRRFRRGGIWVPKKNGKTTLCSGITGYLHIADEEPSAEVYSAANDRGQAGIIFRHYRRMVESSPLLIKRIGQKNIVPSTKTIYDPKSGSIFQSLSADAPTKEGLNIHGLVVDEIHAMKSRVLWDTLIYGGAARRQPLVLSISTAGVYDVMTIGWEQYSYARDIVNGTNDHDWAFFALIYEASKDDDWTSVATWKKANPSYGTTVKPDTMREECVEAQAEPRKQNAFRRYRLNQWTQQTTRWIPLERWDANHKHPVTRAALLGSLAFGGLDIGSIDDMTAFALLCECPHDVDAWDVLMRFWVPEEALRDPANRNAMQYQQWVQMGLLSTTPGVSTNYDYVEAAVLEDAKAFNLKVLCIDSLFQGVQIQNHLIEEGLDVVTIGQSMNAQTPATREFERLWKEGRIHHGGHPILKWMADNTEVKFFGQMLKLVKPNSKHDPRKVDGIQAVINAVDPIMRHQPKPAPQYQFLVIG